MGMWGSKKHDHEGSAPTNGADSIAGKILTQQPDANPTTNNGTKAFGIDHTIKLMRSLPSNKEPALVVAVVKATLESVNVHVDDIVADALRRITEVEARMAALKAEIAGFEREMDSRLREIVDLETTYGEIVKVKDLLTVGAEVSHPAR